MNRIIFLVLVLALLSACTRHRPMTAPVMQTSPADSLSAEPSLFTDKNGTVYLSWIEKRADSSRFLYARLSSTGWTEPSVIAKGTNWFVNWADYPMLAADGNGNLIAHLLEKSGESTYAYDVKLYTSSNDGKTWNAPFLLHDDGKQAEHGFVTLIPYGDKVFVTWLDGRNTVVDDMGGMEDTDEMDHSKPRGAMSLRAAIIDYTGKKFGEWELDNKTCDCCQTTAAITDNGPIVVYRDRTDGEIRDMSIVRYVNNAWTEPKAIHNDNWMIGGCPVNGPRVSVLGNKVAVAWFSAASDTAHVNLIYSSDGGATFGKPVRIDEGAAIGRVDIEWLDEDRTVITWMEGTQIKAAIVHVDRKKEPAMTIAESSDSRSSGFPQMTKTGEGLVFAWTDAAVKRVKVRRSEW